MKRWDYKKILAIVMNEDRLNDLGALGWELVTVKRVSTGSWYYFKRRRQ